MSRSERPLSLAGSKPSGFGVTCAANAGDVAAVIVTCSEEMSFVRIGPTRCDFESWIDIALLRVSPSGLPEGAVRLAVLNHYLAIGIQCIVDNPLRGIDLVVILEAEMTEALGDRVQAGCFRLVP